MSWWVYLLAAVELAQLALIGLLVWKWRATKRRLDEDLRFTRRPPGSITEGLFNGQGAQLGEGSPKESWLEAVRRRA